MLVRKCRRLMSTRIYCVRGGNQRSDGIHCWQPGYQTTLALDWDASPWWQLSAGHMSHSNCLWGAVYFCLLSCCFFPAPCHTALCWEGEDEWVHSTTVLQALHLSTSNRQLQKFTFFFYHFSSSKGVGSELMMSLTLLNKSFLFVCLFFSRYYWSEAPSWKTKFFELFPAKVNCIP